MQILQPMQHPLNKNTLIEASAGTGKTFTIVTLFVRLILNIDHSEKQREYALEVEQILVVTFTKAATQELKGRILEKISQLKQYFQQVEKGEKLENIVSATQDPLTHEIYDAIKDDLSTAIVRLELAEQNMDSAAIFTIHSFCQRMLQRYALQSGIPFGLEITTDERELRLQLCRQYWREYYYPLDYAQSGVIAELIGTPDVLLEKIKPYLAGSIKIGGIARSELMELNLSELLNAYLQDKATLEQQYSELKAVWRTQFTEVRTLFNTIFAGEHTQLKFNGRSYKKAYVNSTFDVIEQWLDSDEAAPPQKLFSYFSFEDKLGQEKSYSEGNADILQQLTTPLFELSNRSDFQEIDTNLYRILLSWQAARHIIQQLTYYKRHHKQKSFDDLLSLLQQALADNEGEQLAAQIGEQYPFAMIDEFQDTDALQYDIFSKIYLDKARKNTQTKLIMIGDPKQSIYAFRNADIYTYLKAAKSLDEQQHYTMDINWRSTPNIIDATNALFCNVSPEGEAFPPLLNPDIHYQHVKASPQQHSHLIFSGEATKPFNFYLTEEAKKETLATCCAENIYAWLNPSTDENNLIKGEDSQRAVVAKDIAVLVKSGSEANLIRDALAMKGIQSVYVSDRRNLLSDEWAKYVKWLLQACLDPHKEQHILRVLASPLFLYSVTEIQAIRQNEHSWEEWVERFIGYRNIWHYQGVLPMLHAILLDPTLQLPQRFSQTTFAERVLTDYMHLAEFLQKGAKLHNTKQALLTWYEQELLLNQGSESEEYRQRLESEKSLVQIVTIHKSKGLEYGIVWLPFIGLQQLNLKGDTFRYHNKQGELVWDVDGSHREQTILESHEELLRLLYVAVTRAKYQVNIGALSNYKNGAKWNALLYLLSSAEIGKEANIITECETVSLIDKKFDTHLVNCYVVEQNSPIMMNKSAVTTVQKKSKKLAAAEFEGYIERNWTISSFTALNSMHERRQQFLHRQLMTLDEAHDYDQQKSGMLTLESPLNDEEYAEQHQPSRFTFPQGAKIGNYIHGLFEVTDFSRGVEQERCQYLCQQLNLEEEVWSEVLQTWITDVLHTPLPHHSHYCLGECREQDKLVELEFLLPIKSTLQVIELNRILRCFHPLMGVDYQRSDFAFEQIKGMIKGFIDLIFRVDGKYYIADYKTNHLGYTLSDYQSNALVTNVVTHNYDLQYLLYTLALHRYLKERLVDYDYEHHFGGVYYLFVRGMNGQNAEHGIYFDKPSVELIKALDDLLERV